MKEKTPKGLIGHLSIIKDPRIERTKKHKLIDILFIVVCGIISGVETFVEIEEWATLKESWFEQYLELPNGIPSHDTLGRVFSILNPEIFKEQFLKWIKEIQKEIEGRVISIDGKTVRRSMDSSKGEKAIHIVSAWCEANRLVLGQEKVSDKSNEIKAIPRLLNTLALNGGIITIDAIGCQRNIADKIIKQKADYILAVKQNQKTLFEDIIGYFQDVGDPHSKIKYDCHEMIEKGHGRIEKRICHTTSDIDWLKKEHGWPHLSSIVRIISERTVDGCTSKEMRYYISSFSSDAKKSNYSIRAHWQIENSCHWVLDVIFNEDQARARVGFAAENLALARKMALNLLKQDKSLKKKSLKVRQLHAAHDSAYLAKIMGF